MVFFQTLAALGLVAPTVLNLGRVVEIPTRSPVQQRDIIPAQIACTQLQSLKPSISVSFPDQTQYEDDIGHYSNASSLPSTCTVEPETVQDVQYLVSLINATRTPFAVKGGGHCNNNNMSSTTGLLISMSKFNQVEVDASTETVKIGTGLRWQNIYDVLIPQGLNILGGRTGEVGVAGFLLSSGYSWKTNEFGFGSDNVVGWDIVLPTGDFKYVTNATDPDLFFALQGGVNNFGFVTAMTVKTHKQTLVWGGNLLLTGDLSPLTEAAAKYANTTTDPKATLAVEYVVTGTVAQGSAVMFYDGPTPPPEIFDDFINIPNATVKAFTRTYGNFSDSVSVPNAAAVRATWHSAPVLSWPQELIQYIVDQSLVVANISSTKGSGILVSSNVEPFQPTAYSHNRGSALSYNEQLHYNTFNALVQWSDAAYDEFNFELTREFHEQVWKKAIELGVSYSNATFLPNYAITGTTVEQIYGSKLPRLRGIQRSVDPHGLLSLTGGFKI